MATSVYTTPESVSTPAFPDRFSAGFHSFKIFPIHGAYVIRDLTADCRQIVYGAAALDIMVHEIETIGAKIERNWRAAMWMYFFANVLHLVPRIQAARIERTAAAVDATELALIAASLEGIEDEIGGGRVESEPLFPNLTRKQTTLIDITFCESCGNDIPDGELCPTCKTQSDADLQPVVTKAPKTLVRPTSPIPGLNQPLRSVTTAAGIGKPFTPRNARTGREQDTSSQIANREMMQRYPHAKTLSEVHQLAMHDYLASKRIAASALKNAAGAR